MVLNLKTDDSIRVLYDALQEARWSWERTLKTNRGITDSDFTKEDLDKIQYHIDRIDPLIQELRERIN